MPRITHVDGFEDACDQAELLRAALDEIVAGDDSFETLDRRDEALRELWCMGASSAALMTFTGMSAMAIKQVVRGARPAGRGRRTRITALLFVLAELP